MTNHSQFLKAFENNPEPLIAFKDLIIEIANYTNKTPSQITDRLERLLFDFRKDGSRNQYDNAFCYCTIFEMNYDGKIHIYEPLTNYFKDTFDHIKGYLNQVIALNSVDVLELSCFSVKRSEIVQRIKKSEMSLLDKIPINQVAKIGQFDEGYISIYDLVEHAKSKHDESITNATYELCNLIKENQAKIDVFEKFSGLKPRLTKQKKDLYDYLLEINKEHGYEINLDEIPF
ncbi:hypothetical protein [Pasteurella multocida]|uniref:hypothetical protein n=1 Tax=Pasteurella multocida TaxID=747 RepID=UPI00397A3B96